MEHRVLWQFQFHFKFHVSRSGVRIPVKAIFCDVTPMTTHINQSINQSIKLFAKYSPLVDRGRKLKEGKKAEKWSSLGFWAPDLENVELELPHCAVIAAHAARFQVRGSNPSQGNFFYVTPMTTHINQSINQSIKLFAKYSPLVDHGRKLKEGRKAEKWSWLGFWTPDLENVEFEVELSQYTVLQWVLIRQLALFTSRWSFSVVCVR